MKISIGLSTLVGLFVTLGLIGSVGFGAVSEAIVTVQWGLLGVILLHLVPLLFSGLAWQRVLHGVWEKPASVFVQARWIREGVSDLLPVMQIGGHLVGARFLTLHGAKAGTAGASVVLDVTMRLMAQLVFTFIGIALLLSYGSQATATVLWWMGGVLFGGLCLLGFILAQRWGLFKLLEKFLHFVSRKWHLPSLGNIQNLHDTIQALYCDPFRLLISGGYHLLSLLAGTVEIWVLLFLMGQPIDPWEALLLESLGQAVRTAGFAVPGALGIQEGGFLLLGNLVGLSPATALGLSLVKRLRDVVLGLPALMVWQLLEGKHLRVRFGQRKASTSISL